MIHSRLLVLAILVTGLATTASAAKRPNFLFIISDDQAPDAIAALGHSTVHTPNLDRLVREGTTFTHTFNPGAWLGAVCAASRTMLITGQGFFDAPRNHEHLIHWAHPKGALAVPAQKPVKLWPELFRDAGYQTFLTGKWHNSDSAITTSFDHAKAVALGMYETIDPHGSKNSGYARPTPTHNLWSPSDPRYTGHWAPFVRDLQTDADGQPQLTEPYTVSQHTSELFADHAVKFLRTNGTKNEDPFFMFVSFNAPHDPRQAPQSFVDLYPTAAMPLPPAYLSEHPFDNGDLTIRDEKLAPKVRTPKAIRVHRSEYYAIITHLDQQIGRILDALDASGEADNTYVIFTSDHGLAVGNHGLLGKQNPYDHSIRMPFTIVGPGIASDQRRSEKIYMQSIFPTTCEIADLPVPASVEFPSLHGALLHDEPFAGEEIIFGGYMENQRYVRTDEFKLITYPNHNRTQLFDLLLDPHEIHDLSDDPRYAATVRELTATLHRLQHEKGDGILAVH